MVIAASDGAVFIVNVCGIELSNILQSKLKMRVN